MKVKLSAFLLVPCIMLSSIPVFANQLSEIKENTTPPTHNQLNL